MSAVEITSLSSKGQVVIPTAIRNDLGISTGAKLAVISDGENILLRPIEKPGVETFKKLISQSREYAREIGFRKDQVEKVIRKVRHENRS